MEESIMRGKVLLVATVLAAPIFAGINVKDFGAVGDGVHDDTAALQRAADSVAGAARENGRLDYLSKYQVSMLLDGPVREICFPRGRYKITGPVVFDGSTTLRGSEAVIVNETTDKDSFFFSKALRVDVEGFTFSGGRTQLRQWTRNRDISSARIVNCRFRGASDTALALDGWALVGKDGKRGEYVAPYVAERGADGLFSLTDRPQGTIRQTANSTLIFVDRCEFRDNRRSIYAHSDGVNIRRCRFFASPTVPADAFVKVATRVHLSDLDFFSEGAVAGRRAVDLGQGTIVADNIRIVAPQGMEAFRSTIKTTTWERDEVFGVGYWLRDITLDTADSPLLSIGEARLPEMVSIKGVRRAGSSSGRKKLFDFAREFSDGEIAAWAAKARQKRHGVEGVFGWAAEGFDEKDFELGVPAPLMRLRHPAGCGVKRDVEFTEADIPGGGKVFADSSIGRDSYREKGDDTDRIEALMRKAAAAGGGTVMLPPRWIDVSRTIAVPRSVRITAPGRAVVRATGEDVVLFRADASPNAFFENIAFSGGACAVASEAAEGRLRFAGCIFAGQSSSSIKTVSQGVSRLRVEAQACLSFTPSLYDGNASPALFDAVWFESSPSFDKTAWQSAKPKSHCGMVNRAGGILRLYDMLGVPCVYWYVKKYDYFTWQPERDAHPELFGDFRWVDNHGDLACVNFRCGGEWGGMTPVYQYGDKAKTVIAGPIVGGHLCAWLRAGNASVLADREEANVTLDEVFYTTCLPNPATVMWRTPAGSLRAAKDWTKANCYPHER